MDTNVKAKKDCNCEKRKKRKSKDKKKEDKAPCENDLCTCGKCVCSEEKLVKEDKSACICLTRNCSICNFKSGEEKKMVAGDGEKTVTGEGEKTVTGDGEKKCSCPVCDFIDCKCKENVVGKSCPCEKCVCTINASDDKNMKVRISCKCASCILDVTKKISQVCNQDGCVDDSCAAKKKDGKTECVCTDCKCKDCAGQEVKKAEVCACSDCKCKDCAFKENKQGASKQDVTKGEKEVMQVTKTGCICKECLCYECFGKGKEVVSKSKSEDKSVTKDGTCSCIKCECDVCSGKSDKGKGDGKGGMCHCKECKCIDCMHQTNQNQSRNTKVENQNQQSADLKDDKSKSKIEGKCCCGDCNCVDCPVLAEKQKPKQHCNCNDCKCESCFFKTEKKEESKVAKQEKLAEPIHNGCHCIKCQCDICVHKGKTDSGVKEKAVKCNCPCGDICKCLECNYKPKDPDICKCPDCKCVDCPKKHISKNEALKAVEETCTCADCKCTDCSFKHKNTAQDVTQNQENFFGIPPLQCDCGDCKCEVCTRKPMKSSLSQGDTGNFFGLPPLQCNCGDCKCVICTRKINRDSIPRGNIRNQENFFGLAPLQCDCGDCKCVICTRKLNQGSVPQELLSQGTVPQCNTGNQENFFGLPPLQCDCGDCKCVICTRKLNQGSVPQELFSQSAVPQGNTGNQANFFGLPPLQCDCGDCKCAICTRKLNQGSLPQGFMSQDNTTNTENFFGLPPSQCDCGDCKCVICTRKQIAGSKLKPTDVCTCPTCTCADCSLKPKEITPKQGDEQCTCKDCKCLDCSQKTKEEKEAEGCTCPNCKCAQCSFKNQGKECTCNQCTCPNCSAIRNDKKTIEQEKCDSKTATKQEEEKCTCPDCTCIDCTLKPKKKGDNADGDKSRETCNCGQCRCANCSFMPEKQAVCEEKGVQVKTEQGNDEFGDKIACTCKDDCTCPVCFAKSQMKNQDDAKNLLEVCDCILCRERGKKTGKPDPIPVVFGGNDKLTGTSGTPEKSTSTTGGCVCCHCKFVEMKNSGVGEGTKGKTESTDKFIPCHSTVCSCENCSETRKNKGNNTNKANDDSVIELHRRNPKSVESCNCCDCQIKGKIKKNRNKSKRMKSKKKKSKKDSQCTSSGTPIFPDISSKLDLKPCPCKSNIDVLKDVLDDILKQCFCKNREPTLEDTQTLSKLRMRLCEVIKKNNEKDAVLDCLITEMKSQCVDDILYRNSSEKSQKSTSLECSSNLPNPPPTMQNITLTDFEILDVRKCEADSLLVRWSIPKACEIKGYQIYIDKELKELITPKEINVAKLRCLNLRKSVKIYIYAFTKCGPCLPPAIALFTPC